MTRLVSLGLLLAAAAAPGWAQDAAPREERTVPASAPLPPADRAEGEASLVRAYQKEFAFLANEERALSERLAELEGELEQRLAAEDAALARLEDALRAEQGSLEGLRQELDQLGQQELGLDEGGDSVRALVSQIEATRGRYGREPLVDPAAEVDLAASVDVARRGLEDVDGLLGELSSVRREQGAFFLPDGRSVPGELLHVGAIATLGAGAQAAGTLAPAGDGALMLWPEDTAAEARVALEGPLPEVLPLYLYESTEKLAEQPHEKTVAELVEKGGVVGYVIVGLGAVAALLLVLRVLLLSLARGDAGRTLAQVAQAAREGDEGGVRAAVAHPRSAAGRVLAAMVPHLRATPEQLESAASAAILRETLRVERFGTAILVSAAVAPLLGLLGTVTGMISTFDVITVFGTGDPKLLSGGISEALITTQLGLTVAIPALLGGNLVAGWAETIRSGMERTALETALLAAELRPEPEDALAGHTGTPSEAELLVLESDVDLDAVAEGTLSVGGEGGGRRVSALLPRPGAPVTPTEATASGVQPLERERAGS